MDELAINQSFVVDVPVPLSSGLIITARGDAPVYLVDLDGEKILQLGDEELFSESVDDDGIASPFNDESVGVDLTLNPALLPEGAIGIKFTLRVRTSAETGWDFNYLTGPGGLNEEFSVYGTPGTPYVENVVTDVYLLAGNTVSNLYVKDGSWYGGVDACQLAIVDLVPITVVPAATTVSTQTGTAASVAYPLNDLPLSQSFPNDVPIATSNGLIITAIGNVVAPISLTNVSGEYLLQIGEEESWTTDTPAAGAVPPFDNAAVGVIISYDPEIHPFGVTLTLRAYVSTEFFYDLLLLTGAGLNEALEGWGPIEDPYLETVYEDVVIFVGGSLQALFVKDNSWRGGLDACRLAITDMVSSGPPTPPAPLAEAGLTMTLPEDLTEYVGKEIRVCANDEAGHVIGFNGTGGSFDFDGEYTELMFVGGGPCCVTLLATSATRMSVMTSNSHCAHFCKADRQACTSSFNGLTQTAVALELYSTGVLPATHSLVRLMGENKVQLISCDDINNYVGRRFTVVNGNGLSTHRINILKGLQPCNAHFQIGDPSEGRQRADSLLLDADKGSAVEFVVVSSDLIVVTMSENVRRCDSITGDCAPVGDVLNLFAGWWALDNNEADGFFAYPEALVLHISDVTPNVPNTLSVEKFAGPPRYLHSAFTPSSNIENYRLTNELQAEVLGPLEIRLDGLLAQINPQNTDELFIIRTARLFTFTPETYFFNYANGRDVFSPYMIYRRFSAPVGTATSPRNGLTTAPQSPPFLQLAGLSVYQQGHGLTDRLFLFDYYVDAQLYVFNSIFGEEPNGVRAHGVERREWAVALSNKIRRGDTFIHTSNLVRAQRTNTARKVTLIETATYSTVNGFSIVTFEGITGPWSVLNGQSFRTSLLSSTVKRHLPNTIDGDSDDPTQRSLHYYFEIDFDSSALPADAITGFAPLNGTVTTVHGPLESNSEYKPFMDLVFYFDHQVFIEPTHHFMRIVAYGDDADPDRMCRFAAETWEQVQRDLVDDPAGIHGGGASPFLLSTDARQNNEDVSSRYVKAFSRSTYNILFSTEARQRCRLNSRIMTSHHELENDPSGELVAPVYEVHNTTEKVLANPLNYHIPLENYCDRDKRYVYYFRTNGSPTPDPLGVRQYASFNYPPYDGSTGAELVGEIVPYGELPCTNCNFLISKAPFNGACEDVAGCVPNACLDGTCESYYEFLRDLVPDLWQLLMDTNVCCMLNATYTSEESIGYCTFSTTQQNVEGRLDMSRPLAPGTTGDASNPRGRREAMSGIMAPMYQWMFGTENAQAVLYDIRGNSGGNIYGPQTMSEFHGAERNRMFGNQWIPRGSEKRPRVDFDELFDPYNLTGLPSGIVADLGSRYNYPEINEALYPGSTNPGANAWIMSNWRATSGGDIFLQAFSGDAGDGDLGAGAMSYVVGNPVGTLWGCNGGRGQPLPTTPEDYLLLQPDGTPVSPLMMSLDDQCTPAAHPDRVTPTFARVPHSFPVPLIGAPGKSGSNAPPHDIETLWWPDIGYINNTRPRLPGDTRPQTPTWPPIDAEDMGDRRDWWLEATITTIVTDLAAKKRGAPADHTEYWQRVDHHRASIGTSLTPNKKRGVGIAACDGTEVAPSTIVREVIATVVPSSLRASILDGASDQYYINGHQVGQDEVLHAWTAKFDNLIKSGGVCLHQDGSLGYTAKATAIPKVERVQLL